jgi:hypothetical protein
MLAGKVDRLGETQTNREELIEVWVYGYQYKDGSVTGYFEFRNPYDKYLEVAYPSNPIQNVKLKTVDGQLLNVSVNDIAIIHNGNIYDTLRLPPKGSQYVKFAASGLRSQPAKLMIAFNDSNKEVDLHSTETISLNPIELPQTIQLPFDIKEQLVEFDSYTNLEQVKTDITYQQNKIKINMSLLPSKDMNPMNFVDGLHIYLVTDKNEVIPLDWEGKTQLITHPEEIIAHQNYNISLVSKKGLLLDANEAYLFMDYKATRIVPGAVNNKLKIQKTPVFKLRG